MSVMIEALPTTLQEFSAMPQRDLSNPENTCAMFLCALSLYLEDKRAGETALNLLRGPRSMTNYDSQFIRDRLRGKEYLPVAYFYGATPDNGYTPNKPFVLEVLPGSRPQDVEPGYRCFFLQTAGADAPRPIKLRKKGENWYLWEYSSILSGIRVPTAEDLWA